MKPVLITLKIFLFMTVLTGIVYPLFITGIAQVLFPGKANGSIILKENKAVGSTLIGQTFDSPVYFSSRPSAVLYNPLPSGGSNYGLTSKKLKELVTARKVEFLSHNHLALSTEVPSEMVFASASGLDPHISPGAAFIQVDRVANARKFNAAQTEKLRQAIADLTEKPQFLFLGEERINVLLLNLEADRIR